jgi:thiol-disulfide isomerase/thioredoxin
MFQFSNHRDELKHLENPTAETCLKFVPNKTLRGWYLAKNVLTRSKAYDEVYLAKLAKYRKHLVTDEQRKRVSDFILTINKFGTGEPALPFSGTTPAGKKVKLSDFKGKVVLVDVWATWCGPCKAQIPHLQKLEKDFHDSDLVFISYSIDAKKDLEKWEKFITNQKLGGFQLIGEAAFKSDICTNHGIKSIPRFLLFDKEGKIVSIDAPRPSDPKLKALLDKHLK